MLLLENAIPVNVVFVLTLRKPWQILPSNKSELLESDITVYWGMPYSMYCILIFVQQKPLCLHIILHSGNYKLSSEVMFMLFIIIQGFWLVLDNIIVRGLSRK